MSQPFISLQHISKRFDTVSANDDVSLDLFQAEVLALLGENGAGKTTLTKILYGMYQPDEGSITINGQAVRFRSPADAIAQGIGFVSQHFSLVPSFTVAENVVLGREGSALVQRQQLNQKVAASSQKFKLALEPSRLVRDLSVGEQQRVEILKALYRDCKLLILDEPTAVLTPQDVEGLFETLRGLQAQGLSVIIITHKLAEAMAISQRVAVLRQGRLVAVTQTQESNARALARLMVGQDSAPLSRQQQQQVQERVILEVQDLAVKDARGIDRLKQLSFKVQAGELLGVAGVAGNGQRELVAILTGMMKPDQGQVILEGSALNLGNPRRLEQAGIGRIPEDRFKAVVADLTVAENLSLEHIPDFTRAGHVNKRSIKREAEALIARYSIKARPQDKTRTLSGGNIQKIILARTLSKNPKLVIAAQPTRGLDFAATSFVQQQLLAQKERAAGVVLLSEDLDEILLLSDRIIVMYAGEIVGSFTAAEADKETIGLLMAGSHHAAA